MTKWKNYYTNMVWSNLKNIMYVTNRTIFYLFAAGDKLSSCPTCKRARKDCIYYPYYSMLECIRNCLQDPVDCLKLLAYLDDGMFDMNKKLQNEARHVGM